MIAVEACYQCPIPPNEAQLAALSSLREIYGVQRLQIDLEQRRIVVEYDSSRLRGDALNSLLRRTGLKLQQL